MFSFRVILVMAGMVLAIAVPARASDWGWSEVHELQDRYGLSDVFEKLVDNRGQGFDPLYGTRNFRVVLNGLVYRGGANNKYHRSHPRSNANPLPSDGLRNLCEEGFGEAVYLYEKNYASSPKSVSCRAGKDSTHQLRYLQHSPLSSAGARDRILELIHRKIASGDRKPVYLHCWNGWHASGYISAVALRQFCGWSAAAAVKYWDRNTDGNNRERGYESIRQRIRDYQPRREWTVGAGTKNRICPGE